jgi:hypothetical protein
MSIPIKITSNPATSFFILFKNVVFIITKEGIILIYNFRDIRYYLKFNILMIGHCSIILFCALSV